ncbi:MAG: hypothetical protein V3U96_12290 [Paracoccaceae bacterium]
MTQEDPRETPREITDDPHKPQDHEKEIKSDKDKPDDSYRYTDWASI